MIDFTQIGKFSWKYHILNAYLRFNHSHVYYKEYRVVHRENIPPKGVPTFVIANHQNGLTDALLLLYLYGDNRQPVFIARGDIFKKEFVAKILRFLKILPTFRDRDGDRNDVRANSNTFSIAADVLKNGGTLTMFPEAVHQHGNYLGDFKKGFPRIVFLAEEHADFALDMKILPVNLYYDNYYTFRSRVLITVGEPFRANDFFEEFKKEHNQAYLNFNQYAREKLRALTLNEDPEFFHEYDRIRTMLREERILKKRKDPNDLVHRKEEDMEIVAELDALKKEDPSRFHQLMDQAKAYSEGLQQLNLRDWLIGKRVTVSSQLLKTLLLIVTFPIFLFGFIHNILPFSFPAILKKKIKDPQLHSSMNFAPSVMLAFPLTYLIIFTTAWIISGKFWFAMVYLLAVFLSLIPFYAYKKYFVKYFASWRYRWLKKKKDTTLLNLLALKKSIKAFH